MNQELFNQALEVWSQGPQLNTDDYHSSTGFLSNSFISDFLKCQYSAIIKYAGLGIKEGFNQNFAIGNLVESYLFEGDDGYQKQLKRYGDNCLTKTGEPYAWVNESIVLAEKMKRHKNIMKIFEAKGGVYHQVLQFDLHGFKWRGEVDFLNLDTLLEVDLKTTTDNFKDKKYNRKTREYDITFLDAWNYHRQRALYQYGIHQQYDIDTNNKIVTPNILAVSKSTYSTRWFTWRKAQDRLQYEIDMLESTCAKISDILSGDLKPDQCEVCDQCIEDEIIDFEVDVAEYCSDGWRY